MAFSIEKVFTTQTAIPSNSSWITEIEPLPQLKPFLRCFWTCNHTDRKFTVRVIPDCCCDIIIDLKTGNAQFVGVSNDCFVSENNCALFGIRFYAWTVSRFTKTNMASSLNKTISPNNIFDKFADFLTVITESKNTDQRIAVSHRYLIDLLNNRIDDDVMNCLYLIIKRNSNVSLQELCDYTAVSKRTLERRFLQLSGVSPKTFIELLRYQLLWQDSIKPNFSPLDSVCKFGYYDQAHMYNDFKKYHGIGFCDARLEYRNLSHNYNTDF